MRCLFAVSSWFVQRASLTVNIELSDVTKWYYSTVPYGRGIWEKESIIGVQWFQKNPNSRVRRSVGNSASLVSHLNGWPSGWDFSVSTEHQWWILFISFYLTYPCQPVGKIEQPQVGLHASGTSFHGVFVMLKWRHHVASQWTQDFLETFFMCFPI